MIKTFLSFLLLATFPLRATESFADDAVRPHDVAPTVISLLRSGDAAGALKSLEQLADAGAANSLTDKGGLEPVCAGLHRSLSQLSSEARFDLLHAWSLPGDSPRAVRVLTGLVPVVGSPAEFARALGERPRSSSFPVSSIGDVRGVFCTGWSLVVAARESGRLKQLMTELGPLVDRKVSNAELLINLARIADGRGDMTGVTEELSRRLERIKSSRQEAGQAGQKTFPAHPIVERDGTLEIGSGSREKEPDPGRESAQSIDSGDVVLALAALQVPALRPVGEQMLAALLVGDTALGIGNDSEHSMSLTGQFRKRDSHR